MPVVLDCQARINVDVTAIRSLRNVPISAVSAPQHCRPLPLKQQKLLRGVSRYYVYSPVICAVAALRSPRDWKHILAAQRTPDASEPLDALRRRHPGEIGRIHGTNAGADDHICRNAVREERPKHAHLNGAEAAPAREYKGGFRGGVEDRASAVMSRRVESSWW